MILVEEGQERKLEHPLVDPFWAAFYSALKKYAPKKEQKGEH
jgi:hypothetical protein